MVALPPIVVSYDTRGMRAFLVCGLLAVSSTAHAHFVLQSPPAYSTQNGLGLPEKSAPCGQADPGTPVVPTNMITSYHAGDMVTITIMEAVFHPGHYRVSLAADQASLPKDPAITGDANSPCGSAVIQDSSIAGVLVDNMLPHTDPFTTPQSFQVALPAGMTCTNCTLQVVEFMSDHPLNNPGGCFYHHCAQVTVVPVGTALPDAGLLAPDAAGATTPPASGGCSTGAPTGWLAGVAVGMLLVLRRRR
jgi:hypothetical protein